MRKFQSFRKIKIDENDALYSEIIRFGQDRCWMCGKHRALACCHIMGRGHYATRFMLEPVRNAIPLCGPCHSWLDTHKIIALLTDPTLRVFNRTQEAYSFIVHACGYSWNDLERLLVMAQLTRTYTHFQREAITEQLQHELSKLRRRRG